MRAQEIDIKQLKSIKEVYSFLETNAYNLERNWHLTDLWVKYKNFTGSEDEKQIAQWEIDCFMFEIKGDRIFSQVYSSGKNNVEIKKYPDLNEFRNATIEYVKKRAISSTNPILKARYNHLLWKSPSGVKHRDFALKAIESYIQAIKQYYQLYLTDKHQETSFQIGILYEILVSLCNEVKSDTTSLKELTGYLLFQASELEFYTRYGILNEMLEYPKLFKPKDFEKTLSLFDSELNKKAKISDDFNLANYHLSTAIKIASKTKSDVKKWHNEKGLAYLRLAKSEKKEDRYWIKQDYHAKAIEEFTLAGNTEKRKRAQKLYSDLKPKVKLNTVRINFDEKTQNQFREHKDYIKNITDKILLLPPDDIYKTISCGKFFPKYSDVVMASGNKENAFLDFVTTIRFDKNKNITRPQQGSENERKLYEIYSYHISMSVLPYLHNIIVPGINSGHLTFENFIRFLVEKSWIGKPHIKYDLGGEEKQINWIGLLSPSIVEFFIQIQSSESSKYYIPSFVLCIDSLTLKMEGLFRNFCERVNIPTIVNSQKGVQEAYVHNVLENETLKKYFNEDDRLLFNYIFSTEGLNMRNNVAHCFYDYDDYQPLKMLLLIAALLRLGKYDYNKVKE